VSAFRNISVVAALRVGCDFDIGSPINVKLARLQFIVNKLVTYRAPETEIA
jgi:hypothetical protein